MKILSGMLIGPMTTDETAVHDDALAVPERARGRLARAWLWLGLAALIGSGLFSILLVVSRTPYVSQWLPVADFFRVALVVHVDLSVLVWFVALAGMLWSINGSGWGLRWGWAALGLCAAGAALISFAPFSGNGEAIMANYIPVLNGPVFISGLLVFGGFVGLCDRLSRAIHWQWRRTGQSRSNAIVGHACRCPFLRWVMLAARRRQVPGKPMGC